MKRYRTNVSWTEFGSIDRKPCCTDIKMDMVEDPNGEWVKWEDVMGWDEQAIKEYWSTCHFIPGDHIKDDYECNCKVMADNIWICPAHGYKRR